QKSSYSGLQVKCIQIWDQKLFRHFDLTMLRDCRVTDEGCATLASALRSNASHLRELNLTGNKLGDSGVNVGNPCCKGTAVTFRCSSQ
uniref:Uncharacterized protein n=1 Tax=Cyprinus carpio TaxID=7962 RepID=A0A8C2H6C7_CYPCA